jgi:hypothetical protein
VGGLALHFGFRIDAVAGMGWLGVLSIMGDCRCGLAGSFGSRGLWLGFGLMVAVGFDENKRLNKQNYKIILI